jgi:trans-aconitate methyltransferase
MTTRLGAVGGASAWLRFCDLREQYGRHVIEEMVARLAGVHVVCDLGVGLGQDLGVVRQRFPEAQLVGIDCGAIHQRHLAHQGIVLRLLDLERAALPFEDDSVDLIIANQVFEHLKELFWLSHQVARTLRLGGALIIGVPNIAALHNRLTFLFGRQPSQMKAYSAHIRGFTASELPRFFAICWPGGFHVELWRGAQFYPFPPLIARVLARWWPSLAHATFYLLRKTAPYRGEFLRYPVEAGLETPFFLG